MTVEIPSRLERWLALVVRYCAFNMTLVHDRGSDWPGFGYSDEDKDALRTIASKSSEVEYTVWLALAAVFVLLIMAGVTIVGINLLLAASGGDKNMANTLLPQAVVSDHAGRRAVLRRHTNAVDFHP